MSSVQEQAAKTARIYCHNRKSAPNNIRPLAVLKSQCLCSYERNSDHIIGEQLCIFGVVTFLPD
jgi:hypothetical protein